MFFFQSVMCSASSAANRLRLVTKLPSLSVRGQLKQLGRPSSGLTDVGVGHS